MRPRPAAGFPAPSPGSAAQHLVQRKISSPAAPRPSTIPGSASSVRAPSSRRRTIEPPAARDTTRATMSSAIGPPSSGLTPSPASTSQATAHGQPAAPAAASSAGLAAPSDGRRSGAVDAPSTPATAASPARRPPADSGGPGRPGQQAGGHAACSAESVEDRGTGLVTGVGGCRSDEDRGRHAVDLEPLHDGLGTRGVAGAAAPAVVERQGHARQRARAVLDESRAPVDGKRREGTDHRIVRPRIARGAMAAGPRGRRPCPAGRRAPSRPRSGRGGTRGESGSSDGYRARFQ